MTVCDYCQCGHSCSGDLWHTLGATNEVITVATSGATSGKITKVITGDVRRFNKRITINSHYQFQKFKAVHLNAYLELLNIERWVINLVWIVNNIFSSVDIGICYEDLVDKLMHLIFRYRSNIS